MSDLQTLLANAASGSRYARLKGDARAWARALTARYHAWRESYEFKHVCTLRQGVRINRAEVSFKFFILSANGRGKRKFSVVTNDDRFSAESTGSVYAYVVAPWMTRGLTHEQVQAKARQLDQQEWAA